MRKVNAPNLNLNIQHTYIQHTNNKILSDQNADAVSTRTFNDKKQKQKLIVVILSE